MKGVWGNPFPHVPWIDDGGLGESFPPMTERSEGKERSDWTERSEGKERSDWTVAGKEGYL